VNAAEINRLAEAAVDAWERRAGAPPAGDPRTVFEQAFRQGLIEGRRQIDNALEQQAAQHGDWSVRFEAAVRDLQTQGYSLPEARRAMFESPLFAPFKVDEAAPEPEKLKTVIEKLPGLERVGGEGWNGRKFAYERPASQKGAATPGWAAERKRRIEAAAAAKDPDARRAALGDFHDPILAQYEALKAQAEALLVFWYQMRERCLDVAAWRERQLEDPKAPPPAWFVADIRAVEQATRDWETGQAPPTDVPGMFAHAGSEKIPVKQELLWESPTGTLLRFASVGDWWRGAKQPERDAELAAARKKGDAATVLMLEGLSERYPPPHDWLAEEADNA
jgi:hypothetical protein